MDSLSQAALGAAVGEVVLGRRAGRRAALWGAAIATVPDLDVFIPLGNDVLQFTAHRSASHSLWLMAVAAPLIGAGLARLHAPRDRLRWSLLAISCLWTHSLLDAFTAYGTRFLWPVWDHPVAWSTLFIIDPAYTLPLLAGVVAALARPGPWGHRLNTIGLLVSCVYLAWSVMAQQQVRDVAQRSLQAAGIPVASLLTTPTPFNTLLWRNLAMRPDGDYVVGYHSLVDGHAGDIEFRHYQGRHDELAPLDDSWPVARLRWFTHGYFRARRLEALLVLSDLRMGVEPEYVFRFAVGRYGDDGLEPLPGRQLRSAGVDPAQLVWVWRRLFDVDAGAAPPGAAAPR